MGLLLDVRVGESVEIQSPGVVSIFLQEKTGKRARLNITGDREHPVPKVSIRKILSPDKASITTSQISKG